MIILEQLQKKFTEEEEEDQDQDQEVQEVTHSMEHGPINQTLIQKNFLEKYLVISIEVLK